MKLVSLPEKQSEDVLQALYDCKKRYRQFDEVLILGKVKGKEQYVRFNTALKGTYFWIGILEAIKLQLANQCLIIPEE